jgi:uncharacterized OB-fold protein
MRVPADPGLYRVAGERPLLTGTRCASCGHASFPPMQFGCDVCGATADFLEAAALEAQGVVHSIVTVHLHQGEPAAPFAVAEVVLDAGPLIRAIVAQDGQQLSIGDRTSAVWVVTDVNDDGDEIVEPRFAGLAR